MSLETIYLIYMNKKDIVEGTISFPGLLLFTLDTHLIMLSVKQGHIKYHF